MPIAGLLYTLILTFQIAAQNCRRRKLGLISKLKSELDATIRTKKQLIDDKQKLSQECRHWATKLSDLEARVIQGLGKNPNKYCLEIVDKPNTIDCGEEYWEDEYEVRVMRKNKRSEMKIRSLAKSEEADYATSSILSNCILSFQEKILSSIKVEIKEEELDTDNSDHDTKEENGNKCNAHHEVTDPLVAAGSNIHQQLVVIALPIKQERSDD